MDTKQGLGEASRCLWYQVPSQNHWYRWNDFVSNQRLLQETGSRSVTSIVRERQLRLYGHVARLPDIDPAHRVFSIRDNPEWRRPRGRPRNSWLGKLGQNRSCQDRLGMDRAAAWEFVLVDRLEWRRLVSDARRPRHMLPISWLVS